jgi:glucose-1-phosphate adenylyltransferase
MQFSSVLPLEGKACMSPVRRGSGGYGSERMRINCCSIRRNKALRRMCFSARGAVSSTQCVLTSDAGPDTLVSLILSIIVSVFHHSPLYFFI